MASISISNIGSTSFSAALTGLQTSGVDYTRKCQWTVSESSSHNHVDSVIEYITQGETKGVTHTFTGLSPNTKYTVSCLVYRTDTGAYLNGFSVEVTTSSSGGGDEGETWTDSSSSLGLITTKRTSTFTLNQYQLRCYTFYFRKPGIATIYTTGTVVDTYGFLTENTTNYDEENGKPWSRDILAESDSYEDSFGDGYDDGLNFSISFFVTADTTYKIWVRDYSGTLSGSVTLCIEPPSGTWAALDMGSLGTITGQTDVSINLQSYVVYRFAVTFANDGKAQFYTTGSVDTYGQYSATTTFDSAEGYADPYIKRNNDAGEGTNFLISDTISAGTTYYIWVSGLSGTDVGETVLHIVPPEGSSTQWTWSDSAHNAFANNGNTRDVPYTEWNEFVKLVAKKTGYPVSSAEMKADDTTLYAIQFNAVRYAIGSVNTFQNGTNSIRDHHTETGQWDMSSGEVVKGQYFIDLAKYLNGIQT